MAIVYTDTSSAPAPAIPTAAPVPDELDVNTLAGNDALLNNVRTYMSDRLGDKGQQKEDESNDDYVERFLTHMRSFENRSLELTGQIDYLRQADETQRKQFLNAYTMYNKIPGFMSEGGGSAASAIADYAYYNVADPINLAGLGVGTIAAKQLAKQGVKGLMLGIARHGAIPFLTDGAIGAGMDLGLQRIEKEVGVRDEYDAGRAGLAFGLSGAGSATAQGIGVGLKKGFDASPLKRNLTDETAEAAVDASADRNLARRGSPQQVAADALDPDPARTARVKASSAKPDAEFDPARGRELLNRISDETDLTSPQVKVEVNRYIYDFLDDMLTDAPNKELALQLRTPSGQRVKDEQITDTVFRVLQDKDLVGKIDEDALSSSLAKAGLSAEEFAQIYRVSVREAAQTLNAASQFSKKLASASVLDRNRANALTRYLTEDTDASFLQKTAHRLANPLETVKAVDRNRRALLVSQIPTLIRNVSTTGIRGGIDAAADVIDAAGFYALRKAQKALGADVPDYSLGHALSDAFGMMRNLADQDFSKSVVDATLSSNPRLLSQISRSVTDIGDGSLIAPVRALNFLNMTHDGLVRRAIYAASLEKQLQRQTGKSIAETIAANGKVPLEFQQKAVREALQFTFADMPTGKFQNAFVKAVENAPFIGTGILTFPRFTVSALNFTGNYVLGGKLAKGGGKLLAAAASGNDKLANEGMTDLSKGIVGTYFLFEAIAHRAQNQDVKWFEYKDDEGKTGDLRPFFPLAPYLLVADVIVKMKDVGQSNLPLDKAFFGGEGKAGLDELEKLPPRDIVEGLLGTRLAGTQLYVIDGFFKTLTSEGESGADGITNQKVNEAAGNLLGELVGGPVNINLITGLVRDIERTFITEAAVMRDSRAQTGVTAEERFDDAFVAAATKQTPFMNRDRPVLESPTREGPMYYQSPLATTFTGIRKSQARNDIENELVRLGITNYAINPSTGDTEANRMLTGQLGDIVSDLVDVTSETYLGMTEAKKRNYIQDRFQSAREVAREIAQGQAYESEQTVTDTEGTERSFTAFDRAQWGRTPSRVRKEVNEYFKQQYGGTVEELGAFRSGVAYASSVSGRYKD